MNIQPLLEMQNQGFELINKAQATIASKSLDINVESKTNKLDISQLDDAPTYKQKAFYTNQHINNKINAENDSKKIFPNIPKENSMLNPVIEKLLKQHDAINLLKQDKSFEAGAISEYLGMSLVVENSVNVGNSLVKGLVVDKKL